MKPTPEVNPTLVLRPLLGSWSSQVLATAMRLDLFSGLEDVTPTELAWSRGWENQGLVRALLAALEGLGFLQSNGSRYRLTDVSRAYLLDSSAIDLRDTHGVFVEAGAYLARRIESALRNSFEDSPHLCSTGLILGMEALSLPVADAIANRIRGRVLAPTHFLDLGGGSGFYSRRLGVLFPDARFLQIDSASANAEARRLAERDGIASRFDALDGDLPGCLSAVPPADIVLCCHLLHYFPPRLYTCLFQAVRKLSPKMLVVADFTPLPEQSPGLFRQLFDVALASQLPGGGIPSLKELLGAAWSAGLGRPEIVSLNPRPSNLFFWEIA